MILRHELQHIRQYDLVLLMLQLPVRIFYWWNPLVTRLMKHFDYVRETLCDRVASQHSPDKYANLLLHFASTTAPPSQGVMAMASSAKIMKARIKSLYSPQKKDLKITGLACAAIVVSIPVLLLTNVQIASAHPSTNNARPVGDKHASSETSAIQGAMQSILQAEPRQRTRIAAELRVSNNPVTPHYRQYQQAQKALEALQSKGIGWKHPVFVTQQKKVDENLQLADHAVFDLLLSLRKPLNHTVSIDPTNAFTEYLKKLKSRPVEKQLDYAASLPVSNNPALIHMVQKETLESALRDSFVSGLGSKHPTILSLQQRLETYDSDSEKAALRATIDLLDGKEGSPFSVYYKHKSFLRDQFHKLRAEGLGTKHPTVSSIEQEIQKWNESNKDDH